MVKLLAEQILEEAEKYFPRSFHSDGNHDGRATYVGAGTLHQEAIFIFMDLRMSWTTLWEWCQMQHHWLHLSSIDFRKTKILLLFLIVYTLSITCTIYTAVS